MSDLEHDAFTIYSEKGAPSAERTRHICDCEAVYYHLEQLHACQARKHGQGRSDSDLLDALESVLKNAKWEDQLNVLRPRNPGDTQLIDGEYRAKYIGDTDDEDGRVWTVRAAVSHYLDNKER